MLPFFRKKLVLLVLIDTSLSEISQSTPRHSDPMRPLKNPGKTKFSPGASKRILCVEKYSSSQILTKLSSK